MNFKKIDVTKIIVKGTEWFSNLALLNLCWLLYSLPLVTLIPATDAVFEVMYEWEDVGKSESVYQQFKRVFQENFKSSFKLGGPILLLVIVIFVDSYFLNQLPITSAWFQILKYAFYTFCFLLVLGVLYAYPLMKRVEETSIRLFVMSLVVAVGHPLTTGVTIVCLGVLSGIFLLWPAMLFFFLVSGVAYIMTKAVSVIHQKNQEKNAPQN